MKSGENMDFKAYMCTVVLIQLLMAKKAATWIKQKQTVSLPLITYMALGISDAISVPVKADHVKNQ